MESVTLLKKITSKVSNRKVKLNLPIYEFNSIVTTGTYKFYDDTLSVSGYTDWININAYLVSSDWWKDNVMTTTRLHWEYIKLKSISFEFSPVEIHDKLSSDVDNILTPIVLNYFNSISNKSFDPGFLLEPLSYDNSMILLPSNFTMLQRFKYVMDTDPPTGDWYTKCHGDWISVSLMTNQNSNLPGTLTIGAASIPRMPGVTTLIGTLYVEYDMDFRNYLNA